jgi:2,3-bisphosphoglycerate-independent phosphoglycerate mutase
VALIILDGWGIAPDSPGNAVTQANTPVFDRYWTTGIKTQLDASGEAVGLPRVEEGNSEAGHLNIGAGRIVYQELPRINMSIADGSFFGMPAFIGAADHVRKSQSRLHLIGLIGAGGVHSSIEHLYALLNFTWKEGLKNVYLHLFTDGRDSPPTAALNYIERIKTKIKNNDLGEIATLCGRFYGMDRDHRWERTQKAYELMVMGTGRKVTNAEEGIQLSYQENKTDEFVEPIVINENGLIQDHDAVIFFNYRIDRPRQLTKAFVLPNFESLTADTTAFDPYAERYGVKQYEKHNATTTFIRKKVLKDLFFVTMTEYETGLPVNVGFIPEKIDLPLSRVLSEAGLRQLHIAETEKERHVTYYFNGRRERPLAGEDWLEVPSPGVSSYDQKPEMSAETVTDKFIEKLKMGVYDFMLVNFANPDMVGHTGNLQASIKACEAVDVLLGKIVNEIVNIGGTALITADHGNVEEVIDLKSGEIDTKHSNNPVPFIVVDNRFKGQQRTLPQGILADIAPTVLDLLEIEKPSAMTGQSLLKEKS